jgi:hypothetical protein
MVPIICVGLKIFTIEGDSSRWQVRHKLVCAAELRESLQPEGKREERSCKTCFAIMKILDEKFRHRYRREGTARRCC